MTSLPASGERQVKTSLSEIKQDHRARYEWATSFVQEGSVVLDAGCGVGYGSYLLASAGASVRAIDRDEKTIDFARTHWQHDAISYGVDNVATCTFEPDLTFDMIVAFEVVEHLVAPELFLRNLCRLSSHETTILLSVPNQNCIAHTIELNPFHVRHFTQSDFRALINRSGLRVEKMFAQDDNKITDQAAGKTLLALCRLDAEQDSASMDISELYQALDDAEREINARANAIRTLQALKEPGLGRTPAQLGILQFALRERAAQVAERQHEVALKKTQGELNDSQKELSRLREIHRETLAALNRANIALQSPSSIRENPRGNLAKDLEKQTARAGNLYQSLQELREANRAQKAFFDPKRPTLAGLLRLTLKHRFFLGILIKAPFYTARGAYKGLVKRLARTARSANR